MTYTSRTILALAALAPIATALDVKDDDLKLSLKLQLQVRAEKAWAKDTSGNQYNLTENVADQESDDMDFYVRRARLGFAGTWKGDYKFAYVLRNDYQDRAVQSVTVYNDLNNNGKQDPGEKSQTVANGTTSNRIPQTNVAYLERVFKQEDQGLEHSLKMGLDYAFFCGADGVFPSASFLFPTNRATAGMVAPRGVGVAYRVTGKKFILGFDIQNNTGDTAGASGDGSRDQGEGLFYGARLQVVPIDSDEKGHMKAVESFLGKEGQGLLVSVEAGENQNDNTSSSKTTNTLAYGVEVLAHCNAITVLAEYRQTVQSPQDSSLTTPDERTVGTCYLVQAGYAVPVGGQVVEPAARWTHLNSVAQSGESANYGTTDYGVSGNSFDLGVNYYLHGTSNKLQLAYQHWLAEDGTFVAGEYQQARADIVRLQWQFGF